MEAKQTPLTDLLERVPQDARLVVEHDKFSSSSYPVGKLCHDAAAALRAALAEPQEPAQQEPVAEVRLMRTGGNAGLATHIVQIVEGYFPAGTKLYTSPPASKPWVGLEPKDSTGMDMSDAFEAGAYWADNKLREKNAAPCKPLTEDEIAELMMQTWGCASIAPRHAPAFARAIEAAHGIKEFLK